MGSEKEIKNQEEKYVRPNWDEYFMDVVRAVAKRGTCNRGRTGCAIVRNNQILATGYVGSPIGQPHCDDAGHQIERTKHLDGVERDHCVRTIHAEVNAIIQAAKHGISIDGGTVYCKLEPCPTCAKMLVNAGIKRVVCERKYHAAQGTRELFNAVGIKIEYVYDELQKYDDEGK